MKSSLLTGLVFTVLWSSASTATKIGLLVGQPFIICIARFFFAGICMLLITHIFMKNDLPRGSQWKQLAIYGLMNVSLYLGIYILAMQYVSPGLGSLSTATAPVIISLITALFLRKPLRGNTLISLFLCMAGVLLAAYPLFNSNHASPAGLALLMVSMIIYSCGTLYYSRINWAGMHILTINGWQTLLGGLFLLPVALFTYRQEANTWNIQLLGSIVWLAIPVSIVAIQLWLMLLRENPLKASFWLFLAPLSGLLIANLVMKEPISVYTIVGMAMVIGGLFILQWKRTIA
ncbi:MAG: EamA family transporter [Chitinophagaceae bacterium]|nr:EamA family transporter [Chitinophagaceae bacterium]